MGIRARAGLVVLLLAGACGTDRGGTGSGAQDLAVSLQPDLRDAPKPDLAGPGLDMAADLSAPADLAPLADLASAQPDLAGTRRCVADADCRLYSSPCKNPKPCLCLPLRVDDPNPTCIGPMVLCDPDPCDGKAAFCDKQTGQCASR